MNLIDWYFVGFSALWIFGLSLNLAALSIADYERNQQALRFREVWGRRGYQMTSNFGLACFCFGVLGVVKSDWEGLIWGVLGAAFLFFTFRAWRSSGAA
jgi:hypothetical protein